MDNISNKDPELWTAITSVQINNNGMRNNFEKDAAFFLFVCTYSNNWETKDINTSNPQIYNLTLDVKGNCNTGVKFFWHTKK